MKRVTFVVGVLSILLGGLWLLQGLGIVHIRPILCFANCTPIEGPSPMWAIIGIVVLIGGVVAVRSARSQRLQR